MINITKIVDYLLIYFLIGFSGIPFFYKANIIMLIVFLLFSAFVFIMRKRKIDKFIIYYIIFAVLIQTGQMIKLYHLPIMTFLGLHVRILFAYFTIKAVGQKTVQYYINILVFSVIVSLPFYLSAYIPSYENFLIHKIAPLLENPLISKTSVYKIWPSIILYTINPKGEGLLALKRNSGPFWEPGAFTGFLIVALLFSIIKTGVLNNKQNRWLILGIITTFSTAGIVTLLAVISFYLFLDNNSINSYLVLPLALITGLALFFSVDFLGNKILSKTQYSSNTYNTRFKSAQLDLQDFANNPFLGLGRSKDTRFKGETNTKKIHRNNGDTSFLATYGIITFILYFYLIYLSFKRLGRFHETDTRMAFFALLTIWMIGFSEIYFTKVFFISLTMLFILYPQNKKIIETHE